MSKNERRDEYLEYRDEIPETTLDFKGLRKSIKDFKVNQAVDVLMGFYDESWTFKGDSYSRFLPTAAEAIIDGVDTGTHNIGIFSTALCLETIAAYAKNIDECKHTIDGRAWVWKECKDRRLSKCDRRKANTGLLGQPDKRQRSKDRREQSRQYFGNEIAYAHFRFIVKGLYGDFDVNMGFLARIATLLRFGNYLDHWEIKDHFIDNADDDIRKKFYTICTACIVDFHDRFLTKREGIHPFELYRFLQFVRIWGAELAKHLEDPQRVLSTLTKSRREDLNGRENFLNQIDKYKKSVNHNDVVFRYFFEEVYLFAKYELYRQMSLKQSGDYRLYDAKRLIYALLTVSLDNKFSNTLIRNKALELIFSPYREDRNFVWPTGQQVAMSKDGLMIITDNECVCDLLSCEYLSSNLLGFIVELKYIYDGYARTKRMANGKIAGWYPIHQRDQSPTSWTSAFTLSFIKRFCKLVSLKLALKAKERFRSNYRKPDIGWNDIYDSTATKAKIRLIFPDDYDRCKFPATDEKDVIQNCRYRTAILFGPPGTGKTTYARALATELNIDYLELTPGDFFCGGEDSILSTINDIFEHLLHLKDTVVFIDEIDDLVKDRNPLMKGKDGELTANQPYDPRTLFVNSLLPRFQELHDKGNIILLMATNNIERVDEAISRMGRVDLVIPIGAISPHGRLKFLNTFYYRHEDVLGKLCGLSENDIVELVLAYLNATEAFNYGTLKQYAEMIIDTVAKVKSCDAIAIRGKIVDLFKMQTGKKNEGNSLLIWQKDVIRKDRDYDTRPRHSEGDFLDFGHFSLIGYPETKRIFQEAIVRLYYNLNIGPIDSGSAEEIEKTTSLYCHKFLMKETSPEKSQQCDRLPYNIMTPFFDDIVTALERVNDEDTVTIELLGRSREHVGKLIFGRSMLPD